MDSEGAVPFLQRLNQIPGRVPYEVLARWCRSSGYDGRIAPSEYQRMLAAFTQANRRLSSIQAVQQSVLSNIEYILSASQLPSAHFDAMGISKASPVRTSVLNFGIPTYVGGYDHNIYVGNFTEGIRQALLVYEPRLDPKSLRISVESKVDDEPLSGEVVFTIAGKIRYLPSGNHMSLVTRMSPFQTPIVDRSDDIFS